MAIKDIPGPGFVGTSTIKWIVTRGLSIGSVATADDSGLEYSQPTNRLHYTFRQRSRLHYSQPANALHYSIEEGE